MAAPVVRETDLSRQKFYNKSFEGQNLAHRKMRSSFFYQCSFDNADMSHADCEGSEFVDCSFVETTCHFTNFKDAKLAGNKFYPRDAYGVTFTMSCKTFEHMRVKQLWWFSMLILTSMMIPDKDPVTELGDLNKQLIGMIGIERYTKLRNLFQGREI